VTDTAASARRSGPLSRALGVLRATGTPGAPAVPAVPGVPGGPAAPGLLVVLPWPTA
jgi:hypothetical protein